MVHVEDGVLNLAGKEFKRWSLTGSDGSTPLDSSRYLNRTRNLEVFQDFNDDPFKNGAITRVYCVLRTMRPCADEHEFAEIERCFDVDSDEYKALSVDDLYDIGDQLAAELMERVDSGEY